MNKECQPHGICELFSGMTMKVNYKVRQIINCLKGKARGLQSRYTQIPEREKIR